MSTQEETKITEAADVKEVAADNNEAKNSSQPRTNKGRKPFVKKERAPREENPYIEKVIKIRRVTKVTKGGKNLNFTALVVVGDGKGKAGYALGKAPEVAEAIRKGMNKAKKSMVDLPIDKESIPHDIVGKFGSHRILLKPASAGTGIIACLPIRAICEASGIHNILTKVLSKSNNPINIIKATFEGLASMKV